MATVFNTVTKTYEEVLSTETPSGGGVTGLPVKIVAGTASAAGFTKITDGMSTVGVVPTINSLKTDISSVGGYTAAVGSGVTTVGTQRMTVATDDVVSSGLSDLSNDLDPTAPTGSIAIAAGNVADGDTITIGDGVHTAITFEFDQGVKATGTIDLNGNPSVGEYITISDGAATKIFEFGSAVQPDAIEITIGGTATDTMTNLITAINASVLTITASPAVPADETCTLLADSFDTNHNVAITESSATIAVTGMSGGLNPGEGITPGNVGVILGATNLLSCTNIAAAIMVKNVANLLDITSTNGGAGTVTLVNDVANTTGNVTITKSGANITVTGMSGGINRITFRTLQGAITDVTNTDGSTVGTKGILIQGTDGTNAQTIAVTTSGEVKQSLDKIAGTATAVNSGAATNGTQRIIHASDDPIVSSLAVSRSMGSKTSQANRTMAVTTSDAGAKILVTYNGHGYTNGQYVSVSGSGNSGVDHDGTWAIEWVDANSFKIADAYVSDQNISVTDGSFSLSNTDLEVTESKEALLLTFKAPANTRISGTMTWYEEALKTTIKLVEYVSISSGTWPFHINTPYWTFSGYLLGCSAFGEEILQSSGEVEYIIQYDKSDPRIESHRGKFNLTIGTVTKDLAATATRVITPYFPLKGLNTIKPGFESFYVQMEDATAGTMPYLQHRLANYTDNRAASTLSLQAQTATDGADLVGTNGIPINWEWSTVYLSVYNAHASKLVDSMVITITG